MSGYLEGKLSRQSVRSAKRLIGTGRERKGTDVSKTTYPMYPLSGKESYSGPALPQADNNIIIVDEEGVARPEKARQRGWTRWLWLIPTIAFLARLLDFLAKSYSR